MSTRAAAFILLSFGLVAAEPVRIGLLGRLTSSGESLGRLWEAVVCSGLLALRHANARNPAVVADFATVARTYAPETFDTGSNAVAATIGYRAGREAGVVGFVGPALSSTSAVVANLGGIDQYPIISYWSSSPLLSDKARFPYFGRTFRSDAVLAPGVAGASPIPHPHPQPAPIPSSGPTPSSPRGWWARCAPST